MTRIDEPLDQIEFQSHRDGDQRLAVVAGIAAPLFSLLNPTAGAITALAAFYEQFRAQARQTARAEAFAEGFRDALKGITTRLDDFERKAHGPEAEEAIHLAWRHAASSARLDKARNFGRILGGTLAADAPNWAEAADFIRAVESLNDEDIQGLKRLWKVQKLASEKDPQRQPRLMSTNANDYTMTWKNVLERTTAAGIANDDWYALCARLSGFGLAVPVQPNPTEQNRDAMVFRITGRALRLLRLLGANVDPGAYPSVKYHASGEQRTVQDEDEELRLGPGWVNTPFQK